MTIADLEWFIPKGKPVTYTGVFFKLYNWRNGRLVHEIHGIIELEKMHISTAENSCNLNTH